MYKCTEDEERGLTRTFFKGEMFWSFSSRFRSLLWKRDGSSCFEGPEASFYRSSEWVVGWSGTLDRNSTA